MLPTIMSQMGMGTDFNFAGEGGQRKGGARADQSGEGQLGTISEQAGDDDVPGKFGGFELDEPFLCMFSFRSCGKL